MNDRQLDSLIEHYLIRSRNQACSAYQREWAFETVLALKELKFLREGVPVEGMVH